MRKKSNQMSKKKGQKSGFPLCFAWCFRERSANKIQISKKRRVIFGLHHVAVRRTAPDFVLGVILELVNDALLLCELKDRVKTTAREKSRIGLKDRKPFEEVNGTVLDKMISK